MTINTVKDAVLTVQGIQAEIEYWSDSDAVREGKGFDKHVADTVSILIQLQNLVLGWEMKHPVALIDRRQM